MRYVATVLLFATIAVGQNSTSTTQTNCTLNGNMANCTSNTQTQVQPQQSNAQSAQQMHDGMEALGTALGTSVAYHKANKWVKKYCKKHPGSTWWYQSPATGRLDGTCPN